MIVFSHGGLNAAPIEAALYAKAKGLKVITVTCGENYKSAKANHSSGKKLGDVADVLIDNCSPLEDALWSSLILPESRRVLDDFRYLRCPGDCL